MAFILSILLFDLVNYIFDVFLKVISQFFTLHYSRALLLLSPLFPLFLLITKMFLFLYYQIFVYPACLTLEEELVFTALHINQDLLS